MHEISLYNDKIGSVNKYCVLPRCYLQGVLSWNEVVTAKDPPARVGSQTDQAVQDSLATALSNSLPASSDCRILSGRNLAMSTSSWDQEVLTSAEFFALIKNALLVLKREELLTNSTLSTTRGKKGVVNCLGANSQFQTDLVDELEFFPNLGTNDAILIDTALLVPSTGTHFCKIGTPSLSAITPADCDQLLSEITGSLHLPETTSTALAQTVDRAGIHFFTIRKSGVSVQVDPETRIICQSFRTATSVLQEKTKLLLIQARYSVLNLDNTLDTKILPAITEAFLNCGIDISKNFIVETTEEALTACEFPIPDIAEVVEEEDPPDNEGDLDSTDERETNVRNRRFAILEMPGNGAGLDSILEVINQNFEKIKKSDKLLEKRLLELRAASKIENRATTHASAALTKLELQTLGLEIESLEQSSFNIARDITSQSFNIVIQDLQSFLSRIHNIEETIEKLVGTNQYWCDNMLCSRKSDSTVALRDDGGLNIYRRGFRITPTPAHFLSCGMSAYKEIPKAQHQKITLINETAISWRNKTYNTDCLIDLKKCTAGLLRGIKPTELINSNVYLHFTGRKTEAQCLTREYLININEVSGEKDYVVCDMISREVNLPVIEASTGNYISGTAEHALALNFPQKQLDMTSRFYTVAHNEGFVRKAANQLHRVLHKSWDKLQSQNLKPAHAAGIGGAFLVSGLVALIGCCCSICALRESKRAQTVVVTGEHGHSSNTSRSPSPSPRQAAKKSCLSCCGRKASHVSLPITTEPDRQEVIRHHRNWWDPGRDPSLPYPSAPACSSAGEYSLQALQHGPSARLHGDTGLPPLR